MYKKTEQKFTFSFSLYIHGGRLLNQLPNQNSLQSEKHTAGNEIQKREREHEMMNEALFTVSASQRNP